MDFRQLSYFVAVAEERHLGRAAERLHLSQPPLTRHIKALESDLGVQLFIRTPRGMLLTEAGETLLKDAQAILGMLHSAADRAQRSGSGQTGRLDVGLYGSATFGVVPLVLTRFKAQYPDVDVTLHYAQTPAQILALRQGRVLIVFERMLPKESPLARAQMTHLRLYNSGEHPHQAQNPEVIDFKAMNTKSARSA